VGDEQLRAALAWLHIVGEVVWCGELGDHSEIATVFLDPTWLCSTLVGYAVAPRGLLEARRMAAPLDDGQYAVDAEGLQALLRASSIGSSGCTVEMIRSVMEYFSLGHSIKEQLFMPIRVRMPMAQSVPLSELRSRSLCVLGRRLRARPPNVFVPGFFPRLQLRCFARGARVWRGGILLTMLDQRVVAVVEAVELCDASVKVEDSHVQTLDISVFSGDGHATAVTRALIECETLIEEVLRSVVPGLSSLLVEVDEQYLGPGCVRRLAEEGTVTGKCVMELEVCRHTSEIHTSCTNTGHLLCICRAIT
jgi:hypothetical protein